MVSLGTQMKFAGAAAGASSAVGKAAGSAKQAAGGSKGAPKAAESDEEDSGVEEATDSAKKDHKIKGEKKVEVGEWMDDLMEGFAELYRLAISGGQSCGDCVRKTTYPIKESILGAYDGVSAQVNPTTGARAAAGRSAAAPTFRHE
ncbi:GA2OX2 [Symbiodinium sp. CCMP2456]|nr:GA2OX2 [Symbiodinium sp. CCMP2456]